MLLVIAVPLGLALGAVCFVLFPPSDLLRRALLPAAQALLRHEHLHIGSLELRPLTGVELRDVWLGPPAGYEQPLFTVRRITVRYDISKIASNQITVRQVQVERPVVRVETRAGKLSWLAFLEGLPRGDPAPEPPPEPPGPPSPLAVKLERVAIVGLPGLFDDGKQRALLDWLDLALAPLVGEGGGRGGLALGAVAIAAGVVRQALQAAIRAEVDMPAQNRSPAGHDVAHDRELVGCQAMTPDVVFPMRAEDVRDLQRRAAPLRRQWRRQSDPRAAHRLRRIATSLGPSALWPARLLGGHLGLPGWLGLRDDPRLTGDLHRALVQGIRRPRHVCCAHVGVERGGADGAVPEEELDGPEILARLQQEGGEGVPQHMRRDPLANRRLPDGVVQGRRIA